MVNTGISGLSINVPIFGSKFSNKNLSQSRHGAEKVPSVWYAVCIKLRKTRAKKSPYPRESSYPREILPHGKWDLSKQIKQFNLKIIKCLNQEAYQGSDIEETRRITFV
jgi:hypothetical protein